MTDLDEKKVTTGPEEEISDYEIEVWRCKPGMKNF